MTKEEISKVKEKMLDHLSNMQKELDKAVELYQTLPEEEIAPDGLCKLHKLLEWDEDYQGYIEWLLPTEEDSEG